MTFLEFISTHPWWTTLWLLIICGAFSGLVNIKIGR